ncbi:MAG: lamin tail domain-containing protein [Melioribacteraceae bacterium]|nr:lamin tail domain-containing protein [Melioribacteraceae bacterium]
MKKILFFFLFPLIISGQTNHLVIAEIYGAGGNSGATYRYDYIVLYNPTFSSIDLTSWSIQYQSATGISSPWTNYKTNLTGSISANSYYIIQESGGTNGIDLPIPPNVIGTISLNATAGKVALVNDQNYIIGIDDSNVIDFVGYGSTANSSEGNNPAPSPSTVSSICRADNNGSQTYGSNGSGTDTDNNGNDFWINYSPSPLPVELLSFISIVFGNKIQLTWSTATEVNNYGFGVERRTQNEEWKKIGFVQGNGNSNSPKNYAFTDQPLGGINFKYRLKLIDFDGSYEYSNEVAVTLKGINQFTLEQNYPNPFNPTTTIRFSLPLEYFVSIKVFNLLGEQVSEVINQSLKEGYHEIKFDGSNLASGVYFYHLNAGNFRATKKFIVSR